MSGCYDCLCGKKLKAQTAKELIADYGDVSSVFCSNCKTKFGKDSNDMLYICDLPNGFHKSHTEGYGLCSKCALSDSEISSESSYNSDDTQLSDDELINKLLELVKAENGNGVSEEDIYLSLPNPENIVKKLRFGSLSHKCKIELDANGKRTYFFIRKSPENMESKTDMETEQETEKIISGISSQEMTDLRKTLAPKRETHEIEHEMARMNLLGFLALLQILNDDGNDNVEEEKKQIKTVSDVMKDLENASQRLLEMETKSHNIINDKFDEIIKSVTQRRDALLDEVGTAVEENKKIICSKQHKLKSLNNLEMTVPERLDIDINNEPLIEVKIDNDKLLDYLNVFGEIEYSQVPLKPVIKVLDTRSTTAEIRLMSVSEKDTKLCTECKMRYGKYLTDEANIKWIESNRYLAKEWTLNLAQLEPMTKYVISVSLCSKYGNGQWSEETPFMTCNPIRQILPIMPCKISNPTMDLSRLFVDDTFDGQDRDKEWYEAKAVQIGCEANEETETKARELTEVKVHFHGWESRFDEWIDTLKEPQRFAPMHHYSLKFEILTPIPMVPLSQPRYCIGNDGREYMIMVCKDLGIIRYDISNDQYIRMDGNMSLFRGEKEFICNVFDSQNNLLYFMSEETQPNHALVYDINKEKYVNWSENEPKFLYPMAGAYIRGENGNNFIYSVPESDTVSEHFKYYMNKDESVSVIKPLHIANNFCKRRKMQSSELLYCEAKNKLMLVRDEPMASEKNSQISKFEWSYLDMNKSENEWNRIELEMSNNVSKCYLVAFDQIIFIFDSGKGRPIFLFDMYSNLLYKSHKQIPKLKINTNNMIQFAVKTRNNCVHLFDIHNSLHGKMDLYEMIPKELYEYYDLKKKLLIQGYVRKNESVINAIISVQIEQIISRFYPVFL